MNDLSLDDVDRIDAAARAKTDKTDCRDTVLLCAGFRALTEERDRAMRVLMVQIEAFAKCQTERDEIRAAWDSIAEEFPGPHVGDATDTPATLMLKAVRAVKAERDAARAALQRIVALVGGNDVARVIACTALGEGDT